MYIELVLRDEKTDGHKDIDRTIIQTDATQADFDEVADATVNSLNLDGRTVAFGGVSARSKAEAKTIAKTKADAARHGLTGE